MAYPRFQQAPVPVTLPLVGKVGPVNGHGVGLTPALLSSVEPIGIVPMPNGAVAPGEELVDCNVPALPAPEA